MVRTSLCIQRSHSLEPRERSSLSSPRNHVSTRLLHRRPSITGIEIPSSQERPFPKRAPFSTLKNQKWSAKLYQTQVCQSLQKVPIGTECPINHLPEEIMLQIFDICVRYHRPWPHWPSKMHRTPPTTLSAVCKYWRRIAITFPRLWTNFDIHVTKSIDPQPNWILQAYLERSRQFPISFVYRYLDEENSTSASLHPTYRLLSRSKNLKRWKQAMIEAPFFHDGWILSHIKTAVSYGCLEHVSLVSHPYDWRFVLPADETGRLDAKSPKEWSSRLGNLRSLSLHIPVELRVQSFSRCLQHLQLVSAVSGQLINHLLRHLPNLRTCRVALNRTPLSRIQAVKHDFLQDFEIYLGAIPRVPLVMFNDTVEFILSSWEFPALKRLVLCDTLRHRKKMTFEPPWEGVSRRFSIGYRPNLGIAEFLERSFICHGNAVGLEALGLFELLIDPDDVFEILDMCPLLQEFALTDIHSPRETVPEDKVEPCCDGTIGFRCETFTESMPVHYICDVMGDLTSNYHSLVVMFYHESLEESSQPLRQGLCVDFSDRWQFAHSPLQRYKTHWDEECLCTFCGEIFRKNWNIWNVGAQMGIEELSQGAIDVP